MSRTRYVYRPDHPKASQNGFVNVYDLDSFGDGERAADAPIMAGRFYENTAATDGTDIGSRQKHREYMRINGLTTMDDYKDQWAKQAKERESMLTPGSGHDAKQRREDVARALHESIEGNRRRK